jgi:hypothetical protein
VRHRREVQFTFGILLYECLFQLAPNVR